MCRKWFSGISCFVLSLGVLSDSARAGIDFSDPGGGWTYIYNGDAAEANLDGTWDHDNGSDSWDGSLIGEGKPGGIALITEGDLDYLRLQDPGDPRDHGQSDPSNRKVFFTHAMTDDGVDQGVADDILTSGGVTLSFRARLATAPPLDDILPDGGGGAGAWPAGGSGYGPHDGGKGSFGVHEEEGGDQTISFCLVLAQEEPSSVTQHVGGMQGLIMNSVTGTSPSGAVDAQGNDGPANILELDPTQWHEFWITIEPDTSGGGTHKVTVYADGSVEANEFHVTAGDGGDEDYSYVNMGLGATPQAGAIDVDFFAYKPGIHIPEVPNKASRPNPAHEDTDVLRKTILSWRPSASAATHNVYLGTSVDDVNMASTADPMDVLLSEGQDASSFDPGILDLGQTYYWRVDEVNGAPDHTVFKGDIWSFTVEPISLPVQGITATASGSNSADMGPEKTIDGSGLDALDQHSTTATDMWLSDASGQPWIQYEFDKVLKLHEMWVWNSNQMIEAFIGLGGKDVIVETSLDGATWTLVEDAAQFAQATGLASYTANTVVDFGGAMAQFVRITIDAGWGALPQHGLSEVRFFSIPVQAREPQPADGAAIDGAQVVLKWRAGREAASHEVRLGTDSAALALVGTTDEASFDPGALDYGTTYYWQIDEVNLAATPATHAGNVWSFTTPPFGIVDDFDQYDDNCNRIFFAWADGLGHNGGENVNDCEVPASNGNGGGSIVGNDEAPFAEQGIVTAGSSQSLPFNYDNSFGLSEATLTLSAQDWTVSAVQTLSLAFYGTAGNTGTLYVKINDTKVSYDLDPTDIARASWQAWNIDLTALSGLQNVTSLTIGVDGGNAAGTLYIDDIRLHAQPGELITPAQPSDVGLLAHLTFDEGAGAIAGDSSGNGHDGTLVGPPQWVAGKVGGALQFGNGTHVLDDDAEDYVNGLTAITIAMWIKSNVIDTDSGFIIFDEPAGNDQRGIRYDADGGEGDVNLLKYGMAYTSGNEEDESPANLQTTDWQHVAVTSASGAGLTLYINGVLVIPEEDDGSETGVITGCTTLIIGKGGKDEINSAGWDGLIDDVRIYSRALSAEEVMGLAGRTQAVHKPL